MTEDNRIPEIRAYHHRVSGLQGDDIGTWCSCSDLDCKVLHLLDRLDAVHDSAPPAPRVFLPNDRVPVGTVVTGKGGSPFRVPDTYATDGLASVGVPFVEVFVPSPEEWQAAVDRASEKRANPDTEGT